MVKNKWCWTNWMSTGKTLKRHKSYTLHKKTNPNVKHRTLKLFKQEKTQMTLAMVMTRCNTKGMIHEKQN